MDPTCWRKVSFWVEKFHRNSSKGRELDKTLDTDSLENWVFEIFRSKQFDCFPSLYDPPVKDTCFAQRFFEEMFASTLFLARTLILLYISV